MPELHLGSALLALCVAAGIGLLIGAERERRKGSGPTRGAAGIRTFTAAALLGVVAQLVGDAMLLAVATGLVGVLAVIAYQRSREQDPGMTTEVALLLTCVLGGLAVSQPTLAAAVGVALAALLAARDRMHRFVRRVLTERELHDAILFGAAALIALPLAPDRYLGPFEAINPHTIARLVVLVMAVSALGYGAVRAWGSRRGLALAGLASGFVSSMATIHAMGRRTREHPAQARGAVAGAVLSSVATVVQLAIVVALVQPALLRALAWPLALALATSVGYGLLFVAAGAGPDREGDRDAHGRAFDLSTAVLFAAIVTAVLLLGAAMNQWLGPRGTVLASALAGLADAHAAAASVAALVAAGKLPPEEALIPILVGVSSNALMKAAFALHAGGAAYAARIVPGLVALLAALWLGAWIA